MTDEALFAQEIIDAENDKFLITPYAILFETLQDYNINVGKWKPNIWEHIFDDFMYSMEKFGYIEKQKGDDVMDG